MPDDQDIIAAVNERARGYVNAAMEANEKPLPHGFRCDMSRVGLIRRCWERAALEYKDETGHDVREAIANYEAWLRSPQNAPQLYVERR